jgi:hypothetical protein
LVDNWDNKVYKIVKDMVYGPQSGGQKVEPDIVLVHPNHFVAATSASLFENEPESSIETKMTYDSSTGKLNIDYMYTSPHPLTYLSLDVGALLDKSRGGEEQLSFFFRNQE